MTDLTGRVVVVTGGNGGIGLGMARASTRSSPTPASAVARRRTPVRRWGEPDDLGPAAVFLADPTQTFHTGDMLVVDGGYTVFQRPFDRSGLRGAPGEA